MTGAREWLQIDGSPGATLLELPIYLLLVVVMAAVGVSSYFAVQRHLHVLDAISVATDARLSMVEYRAVTGTWPASNRDVGIVEATSGYLFGERVRGVWIQPHGGADVGFGRAGSTERIVSLRAWEGASAESPTGWVCAHAAAPRGVTVAADHTTLADADLPSPCRTRR